MSDRLATTRTLSRARFVLLLAGIALVWGMISWGAFCVEMKTLKPDWYSPTNHEIPDYFHDACRRLYRRYHARLTLMAAIGAGAAAAVYFGRTWRFSRASLLFLSWPMLFIPVSGSLGALPIFPCIIYVPPMFLIFLLVTLWRKRFWDLAPLALNAVLMVKIYAYANDWFELFD